jgi:hypothetical protein
VFLGEEDDEMYQSFSGEKLFEALWIKRRGHFLQGVP